VHREQRRLAAIVVADMVGYSRLMGSDETGTLAELKTLRRELIDPQIKAYEGRIVKTTGDGMLLDFASVVDAVKCMIDIQTTMAAHNANRPADRRIDFRIGINIGDIIIEGDDIFGDGVNVAARLQELAAPGGVCVSDFVQQQMRGKIDFALGDMGEQQVKNIAHPVRAWRVEGLGSRDSLRATISAGAPTTAVAGERAARPGLAVLPFDNLGGDASTDDFCDGLAEDLITALTGFRWVHVISRKSSFVYKKRSSDIRQVAQELGVNYVLEGSVRRAGKRVRISAQLINARTGNHTWAKRYDREVGDVFEQQDEIVDSIVAALDYALWYGMVRGETGAGLPNPVSSPLRAAAWHAAQNTKPDLRLAIDYARRALEQNPRSVAAYQYMALAHCNYLMWGWSNDPATEASAAIEAGRQAVALSPADGLSHAMSGFAMAMGRNGSWAVASGQRALSLNARSANTIGLVGLLMSFAGAAGEANELIERTLDLAPAHFGRPNLSLMMALNWLRLMKPERGLPCAEEAKRLKPEAVAVHVAQAVLLAASGRPEQARAAAAQAIALRPDLDRNLVDAMFPYSAPTDRERLVEAARATGIH
jgi:adenylate cyclase